MYKILFDLKNDLNDLKKITLDLIQGHDQNENFQINNAERIQRIYSNNEAVEIETPKSMGQNGQMSMAGPPNPSDASDMTGKGGFDNQRLSIAAEQITLPGKAIGTSEYITKGPQRQMPYE